MSFQKLWAGLVKKKPTLENEDAEVIFSSKNFKLLLRQVYDQGVKSGKGAADVSRKLDGMFDNLRSGPFG